MGVFRYTDNLRRLMISMGMCIQTRRPTEGPFNGKEQINLGNCGAGCEYIGDKYTCKEDDGSLGLQESNKLVLFLNDLGDVMIQTQQAFRNQSGKGKFGEDGEGANQKRTVQNRIEPGKLHLAI
jgi:hypothetical protein